MGFISGFKGLKTLPVVDNNNAEIMYITITSEILMI